MIRRLWGPTLLALAILLSACNEPEVSATARCTGEPYVNGEAPESPRKSLLLLDLSSNDEAARQAIVEAIRPIFSEAVADGGAIRFVVNGGAGRPMEVSACLDGKTLLHTDYNNPTTEENEQERAIGGIEGNLSAMLAETRVVTVGNVTNLIAEIPEQLAQLDPEGDWPAGAKPTRVVLISDLISPVGEGDCMSIEEVPATAEAADQIVAQCLRVDQYQVLPGGVELQVVRPQLTPGDSTASRMSKFLASSLCDQLTGEEGACRSGA